MPVEMERIETAEVILAEKIALHIKALLGLAQTIFWVEMCAQTIL